LQLDLLDALLGDPISGTGLIQRTVSNIFGSVGLIFRLNCEFVRVRAALLYFLQRIMGGIRALLGRRSVSTTYMRLPSIDSSDDGGAKNQETGEQRHFPIKIKLLIPVLFISFLGFCLLANYFIQAGVKNWDSAFEMKRWLGIFFSIIFAQFFFYLVLRLLFGVIALAFLVSGKAIGQHYQLQLRCRALRENERKESSSFKWNSQVIYETSLVPWAIDRLEGRAMGNTTHKNEPDLSIHLWIVAVNDVGRQGRHARPDLRYLNRRVMWKEHVSIECSRVGMPIRATSFSLSFYGDHSSASRIHREHVLPREHI